MNKLETKEDRKPAKSKQTKKLALQAENDLSYVEGHEDEFIGHLQKLTGWSREEIERIVKFSPHHFF